MLLGQAGLAAAFIILLVIILIGILFDIVGVAVTAADVKPFIPWRPIGCRGAGCAEAAEKRRKGIVLL